jgi:beta-glucanase (GH16 family)
VLTGGPWRLVFDATFSGSHLDKSIWGSCYPWQTFGCTNFGNREYEWYLSSQDRVSGSALHLVAQHIPTLGLSARGTPERYMCRSGVVNTYRSFHFEYGHLQVVARIPSGSGLWSALWLAAADLRWPPEIDLLEQWGPPRPHAAAYFHPSAGPRVMARVADSGFSSGWHTFDLYWSPSDLTWMIDGREILSTRRAIPHQMMYFVADLADYSLQSSGSCNGQLLIRSVKVWQQS